MNIANPDTNNFLAALGLPSTTLVQRRVPKKMLAENGAATAADRKLVQDRVEELTWHAALKPNNVGIAAYEDERRSYLEVTVLLAKLRTEVSGQRQLGQPIGKANTTAKRVAELVHRAVPYPALLLLEDGQQLFVSMAHIRWAQREAEKTVLDSDSIIVPISAATTADARSTALIAFFDAMALSKQPRSHMQALYQGWFDALSAWQAVELTGYFKTSENPAQAAERRVAWRICKELDARIAAVRIAAAKEKQVARQVGANLEIKNLLAERQRVAQSL